LKPPSLKPLLLKQSCEAEVFVRHPVLTTVREELLHFFQCNKQIAETIMAKVKDTQGCERNWR
jgi:hypothetical protein